MQDETYDFLNKQWKATCRILFQQELGELKDHEEWLKEYQETERIEKSGISGKEVSFSVDHYSKSAKYLAFDEVDFTKKFQPLSINEIKDIDGIVGAVKERLAYTGNIYLGNSSHVKNSSNVIDSHFIIGSKVVVDAKYLAYCTHIESSESCFGMLGAMKDSFCIKCMGSELARCFECHMVELLSDCYYCAKAQNSRECMFSFGIENKSYTIGNIPLEKGKYLALKSKLLSEIAQKMRKGEAFSLLKLIDGCSTYQKDKRLKFSPIPKKQFSPKPIENAFSSTCGLLFGKNIGQISDFPAFLAKNTLEVAILKSSLSGELEETDALRVPLLKKFGIQKRIATEEEMREIGKLSEGFVDISKITYDFENLCEILHLIAYLNLKKIAGPVSNLKEVAVAVSSHDCYHGSVFISSKNCAYCVTVRDSEAIFGSRAVYFSSFCMKNFFSKNMSRSLECDNCRSCSDAYYLHNCENVRDSMFCFNVKNRLNAIGNAELLQEQYKKIKSSIVFQLAEELERKKDLKWSIFNLS